MFIHLPVGGEWLIWILKMDVMTELFSEDRHLHHLQCCHVTVNRPKMQLEQHCKMDWWEISIVHTVGILPIAVRNAVYMKCKEDWYWETSTYS